VEFNLEKIFLFRKDIFRWYSSNYAKAIGMPETPDGSPLGLSFLFV
jgi:hypothetical protein